MWVKFHTLNSRYSIASCMAVGFGKLGMNYPAILASCLVLLKISILGYTGEWTMLDLPRGLSDM